MRIGALRTLLASTGTLIVLSALPCAAAIAAEGVVSPLPASDYTVRHVCAAPAPGHAGCLALALVGATAAARAHTHPLGMTRSESNTVDGATEVCEPSTAKEGCYGLRPEDLRDAYFPGEQPAAPVSEPQTIALVDAYNDPHAEADLNTYAHEFNITGLARCTAGESDCFEQVNQEGETGKPPFPADDAAREAQEAICFTAHLHETKGQKETREAACEEVLEADGWAVEISTDIEVAHAVCQNCKILLVEADSAASSDLEAAESTAVTLGATEISNSWGGAEPQTDSQAFNHPGIVIAAAAGDDGYLNWTNTKEAEANDEGHYSGADYPASSPHVIAVGGTRLSPTTGGTWQETVWNDDLGSDEEENHGAGGSGCSLRFTAQIWQREVPDWSTVACGKRRAVADVSADGDPYSGVAVYDSVPDLREEGGQIVNTPLAWWPIGGTSVASPIIASMFALAGGAHGVAYPAATLYSHLETSLLHTVTAGGNGACDDIYTSGCTGSMNPLSPFDCGAGVLICNAALGCAGLYYDGPAGVGTPNGIGALKPEERPAKNSKECPAQSKPVSEITSEGNPESSGSEGPGAGGASSEETWKPFAGLSLPPGAQPAGPPLSIPGSSSAVLPILSAPTLTRKASAALRHGPLKIATIAFAFTLNVPARVQVTLAERVLAHGHKRWRALPDSLAVIAAKGRDSAHLRARGTLSPGRYRLTLTPLHGRARSISFRIA